MHTAAALITLAGLASTASAHLNILLSNDDGWGSANIRAAKSALEAQGHKVLLLGPLDNQSGVGNTVVLPTSNVSETGGLYGLAQPGASWYGYNESDTSIRYMNATPAGCVLWGLNKNQDFFDDGKVDLVVTGANEGTNLGSFVMSLSGTCGGALSSAMFGVPSVAFSARNSTHRPYTSLTDSPYDPATLSGGLVADLVSSLADGWDKASGKPLLPAGTGLNVNFPYLKESCSAPPFVLSNLAGGAYIDGFELNEDGFPEWINVPAVGLNTCTNQNCDLPGETEVIRTCQSSISVFTVSWDAPEAVAAPVQDHIRTYLAPVANKRVKRSMHKRGLAQAGEKADVRRRAF